MREDRHKETPAFGQQFLRGLGFSGVYLLLGVLVVLGLILLAVIQSSPLQASILAACIGIGQLMVAGFLYKVNKNQVEIQLEENRRGGAIVQGEQVPVRIVENFSLVVGIELWNAGRQATQIRDFYLEASTERPALQISRYGPTPDWPQHEADFEPIGNILVPGQMWQLKIRYLTGTPTNEAKPPVLVVVPVLGDPYKIFLASPTKLQTPFRSARF